MRDANPHVGFSRHISKELLAEVLARDGFTYQMFGIARESLALMMQINKVRIHIRHIVDKSTGGKDVSSNLRAL